jgi:hypothetical protein
VTADTTPRPVAGGPQRTGRDSVDCSLRGLTLSSTTLAQINVLTTTGRRETPWFRRGTRITGLLRSVPCDPGDATVSPAAQEDRQNRPVKIASTGTISSRPINIRKTITSFVSPGK